MADIEIIPFQPILFRNTAEIEPGCECNKQSYCQIIAETDPTQFQIKSSNVVINGDFEEEGESWEDSEPLIIALSVTNESSPGACDGQVFIEVVSGNTGIVSFSLNGAEFQSDNDSYYNLCAGCGFITAQDEEGKQTSAEFCIVENIDCSEFEGATLEDVIASGKTLSQFYNCTLNDLKP